MSRKVQSTQRRARRILPAYCHSCEQIQFFDGLETFKPKDFEADLYPSHVRKVRGYCMFCENPSMFVTTKDKLENSRLKVEELCNCGLPYQHEPPCRTNHRYDG